jgi:hypothetical protein
MFLKCEFELVDDGRENGGQGTGEVVSDNGDPRLSPERRVLWRKIECLTCERRTRNFPSCGPKINKLPLSESPVIVAFPPTQIASVLLSESVSESPHTCPLLQS